MERNLKFIDIAIKAARSSQSKFRLGAVVVKKNRIISFGYNKMNKTHPIQQKLNKTDFLVGIHAEVHACLGVDEDDLNKSDIYVARISKCGKTALAKPCNSCYNFLSTIGVRRVYFTCDDGTIGTLELN